MAKQKTVKKSKKQAKQIKEAQEEHIEKEYTENEEIQIEDTGIETNPKKTKKDSKLKISRHFIIFPIILAFGVFAYFLFTNYKPNPGENANIQENNATTEALEIPKILNSEIISENTGTNSKNVTLQTQLSPEEVLKFYDIAMERKGWEIDAEGESGTFLSKRYKNGRSSMSVSASRQLLEQGEELTIVTIEAATEE